MTTQKNNFAYIADNKSVNTDTNVQIDQILVQLGEKKMAVESAFAQMPQDMSAVRLSLEKRQENAVRNFSFEQLFISEETEPQTLEDFHANDPMYIWYWFSLALSRKCHSLELSVGMVKRMFRDARKIALEARNDAWVHINMKRYRMIAGPYSYDEQNDRFVGGNAEREQIVMLMVSYLLKGNAVKHGFLSEFVSSIFETHYSCKFNFQLLAMMGAKRMDIQLQGPPKEKCITTEEVEKKKPLTKRQLLFATEEEQKKWAGIYITFLKEHRQFNKNGLTKDRDSFINRSLACFVYEWHKANILKPKAIKKAPSLFLFYNCNIAGSDPKTHGNECENIMKECLKTTKNTPLHSDIIAFVKQHL